LVSGTIAPDLMYFLRFGPHGGFGHTLAGAFLFSLPASLVFLWMLHRFVKMPIASVMPVRIQQRLIPGLGPFRFGGARRFGLIVLSSLIGIATHIAWDSFTHPKLWLYRHWAPLRMPVLLPVVGPIAFSRLLQHVSTVLGLGVLAVWLAKWYRRSDISRERFEPAFTPAQKAQGVLAVIAIAICAGAWRGWAVAGSWPGWAATDVHPALQLLRVFSGNAVITMIAILWWEIVLIGSLMRFRYSTAEKVA
jgi:hypothetical protein